MENQSVFWLAWAMAAPLAGSVLAFVWPRRCGVIGLAAVGAMLLCAVALAAQVVRFGSVGHRVGGWGASLGIDLRADGLSAILILMTAVVGLGISGYALRYFDPVGDGKQGADPVRFFWPLWLFLLGGLVALFATADLFNAYVTLEVVSFAGVALVSLGGGRAALRAAIRYLFVGLVGALFYLLGFSLLYGLHGTADLNTLSKAVSGAPVEQFAGTIMLLGLALKTALFPLHFWLPPAHSSAPTPVSAALSALVVKGTYYLILRLWFELFGEILSPWIAMGFGALGAAAILVGSVAAMRQTRIKLLVAYGTVSQLGYLFLVFPLASLGGGKGVWVGAVYFAVSHALAKSAMFLAAGNIIHAAGHDRIADLRGVARVVPVTFFAFGLAGINAIGLPPSGGFMAKWLMMSVAVEQGRWIWVVVLLVGGLLSAAYVVKILNLALMESSSEDEGDSFHSVSPIMEWTAFALAVGAIGLGVWVSAPIELLESASPLDGVLIQGGAP